MAVVGFCTVFLATWSLALSFSSMFFEKIDGLKNRNYVSTLPVVTQEAPQLECARVCASRSNCSSFNYAINSRWCMMSSEKNVSEANTLPASEPAVFYIKNHCPSLDFWFDKITGMCFIISEVKANTWLEAVNACRAQSLELAILDTPERQAAVMETIRANPTLRSSLGVYVYIGGARPEEWWGNRTLPDTYYWLDGTEVEWHNSQYWGTSPRQPNGYGTEECLGIQVSSLTIFDRRTTDVSRYICQA